MNTRQAEVVCVQEGRAGLIHLARPRALNALSRDMIEAMEDFLVTCLKTPKIYGMVIDGEGKGFCAGADVRAVQELVRSDLAAAVSYFSVEYRHVYTLSRFTKPHVALIDGIVMGGGVGISLHGTHRVMASGTRFAMPETGIGFIPDVGASLFLSRLPGKIGLYLGLTGTVIGQADAFALGFATHCVEAEKFPHIRAAMAEGEPIDTVLAALHQDPGPGELLALRPVIDRLFTADRVEDIFHNLESEEGAHADFARRTLELLTRRSPLSLKVVFEQLRCGAKLGSLKEALALEHRLARRMIAEPDFYEGVRATLIDKDHNPRWDARSLGEVTDAKVMGFFEPGEDEFDPAPPQTLG